MRELLLVGTGGFVGAVLRYLAGGLSHRLFPHLALPLATLLVNVAGCLLLGVLAGFGEARGAFPTAARLLLMVGLLGSFTTYSTFTQETYMLAFDRTLPAALANVALHLLLGFAAVAAGNWLGQALGQVAGQVS